MSQSLDELSLDTKLLGKVSEGSPLARLMLLVARSVQANRARALIRGRIRHLFDVGNGDREVDQQIRKPPNLVGGECWESISNRLENRVKRHTPLQFMDTFARS
jgi:hypothetical protein